MAPLDVAEPVPPLPRPALPPYNGHGGLDDSRQNCVALVPRPPRKVRRALSVQLCAGVRLAVNPSHHNTPTALLTTRHHPPTHHHPTYYFSYNNNIMQQDVHKLMNKDKIILRFTARMLPAPGRALSAADAGRRFVLSYFMMDDTLLIVSLCVCIYI